MRFTETKLQGAYLIDLERKEDERGFFARAWSSDDFQALGLDSHLKQCSVSWNAKAGTLRGLHYQAAPHDEMKIVRCTMGAAWDVVVDLRPSSSTYRQWVGVEISAENRLAVYISKGFAHGFQSLVDSTELLYLISSPHMPNAARGVRWNDPSIGVKWPLPVSRTSEADKRWPLLER